MKASAILIAAMLAASGSAHAQQYDSGKRSDGRAVVKSSAQPKEGVGTKLKDALRRAGDKTRQAFNRGGDRRGSEQAMQSGPDTDTRRMGAPAANDTMGDNDRARRTRMDDAYSNWRARQKQ